MPRKKITKYVRKKLKAKYVTYFHVEGVNEATSEEIDFYIALTHNERLTYNQAKKKILKHLERKQRKLAEMIPPDILPPDTISPSDPRIRYKKVRVVKRLVSTVQ